MPSSISNSEPVASGSGGALGLSRPAVRRCWLSVGIEVVCRFAVPRISRIERRTQIEYQDLFDNSIAPRGTRALTPFSGCPSAAHGIVVGNSLLVAGVRFEELKQRLLPDIDFKRFAVEDTGYFDWKYGMRRLFTRRPPGRGRLVMTPRQFMITGVRGEYFAYHLINLSDVLSGAGERRRFRTRLSATWPSAT